MKIEIMIYCYGAICASMILFNFICIFAFKSRQKRTLKRSRYFTNHIRYQISLIERGNTLSNKEYRYLVKKLKSVGNLLAFDKALEQIYGEDRETAEKYIKELHQVLVLLADTYSKKEDVQSTFFLHVINKYEVTRITESASLIGIIKMYFEKESVYCCLNAMDALCISGNPGYVLSGLKELDSRNYYYPSKIITRELKWYQGDCRELSDTLIKDFVFFSTDFKIAVIDYFRSLDIDNNEFVYELLTDDRQDDEIQYSAIRYFGKHKFQPAFKALKEMISDRKSDDWICVAQAITAISHYSEPEVVQILKNCLSSSDWYARYNAAVGLERMGVAYNGLADIINGNDRYARDIITYMSEHRSLHEIERKEAALV